MKVEMESVFASKAHRQGAKVRVIFHALNEGEVAVDLAPEQVDRLLAQLHTLTDGGRHGRARG